MMAKTRFKGHETFYFREGWLSKVISEIDMHPDTSILTNISEGIAKLGVGANMVKSIKYWATLANIVCYDSREKRYVLTRLGNIIAHYDIYLEDAFTLWLIHLEITNNFEKATTWNLFWKEFKAEFFTSKEVYSALKSYLESNNYVFNEKSLENDILVLLAMYSKEYTDEDSEENAICPLAQLKLIKSENNIFKRNSPNISDLNALIVFYALQQICKEKGNIDHLSINDVEEKLFLKMNIDRIVINEYLDVLARKNYIRVDRTAGLNMLYVNNIDVFDLLVSYYEERGNII